MELHVLASGSSGNAYLLHTSKSRILLECGINIKDIKIGLEFNMSLDGCLISHSHKDHCKAISGIVNQGINCFMSEGCRDEIGIIHHRITTIRSNEQFKLNELIILPFVVEHDTNEPLGYLIYDTISKEKLLFATDTYYLKYKFKDINYYMIECNYDKETLEENISSGVIHQSMRKRLLSSHFSINNLHKYFEVSDLSECRKIVLIHLSSQNSSENFKERISTLTGIETDIAEAGKKIKFEMYPF